ncbi:hypothetical protein [Natronorarus salvus]|uniref:hypothetical protein n=1 Tax=Natronorarus salvus TaxID=3117733 RepID=UPI002F26A383
MISSRRSVLKAAGGTLIGASVAGCLWAGPEQGSADPVRRRHAMGPDLDVDLGASEVSTAIDPDEYDDQFSRYVHLADEMGADPTGQEDATPVIESAWSNDTLIDFGDGEYKMNSRVRRMGSENVGLIGQNAVIRHGDVEAINGHTVTSGEYIGNTILFNIGSGDDRYEPHYGTFLLGGFTFDWGWHYDAGMQATSAQVDGTLEIRNIQFAGVHSLGTHGNLRVGTLSPSSTGLVDSIDMRGGGLHYRNTINTRSTDHYTGSPGEGIPPSWSTSGITGISRQQGTLHVNNVWCGGWPDNGIYVQGGEGRKIVSNCVSANSNVSNIRVNGGDVWEPVPYLDDESSRYYDQTTVEDCLVIVDQQPDEEVHTSQRGIWLRNGRGKIRDSEVILARGGLSTGAGGSYAVGVLGGVSEATVENLRIELHDRTNALYISSGGDVSVSGVEIETIGWDAGLGTLISGGGSPSLEDIVANGSAIA